MYVIYHSSDAFADVTGVSIASLFENNQHFNEIHVLYIEKGMSEKNKGKLQQLAETYGRTIEFMKMPNWSKKLNITLKTSKKGWLGFGYNRLFLTEYVPETVDKVLYLDSDTVIEEKLDDLWNTDLTGYYMAGVDDCLSREYRGIVDMTGDGVYCNAGMLLFNLKKWREDNVTELFLKMVYENNGYFVFNDQTILNSAFCGKVKILPQKYNVNSLVYLFEYKELMHLRHPLHFSYSKEEFYDARLHPVITHYTGNFYVNRRPWVENSDHPHKDAYLKYKALTPWKDAPLKESTRKKSTRIFANICHVLPRPLMILLVSVLYNKIRPMVFRKNIKKERQ